MPINRAILYEQLHCKERHIAVGSEAVDAAPCRDISVWLHQAAATDLAQAGAQ